MFEELARLRPAVELVAVEKVVVAAIDLALARRARRRGQRQLEPGHALQQLADQGPLPDPRRPGDHEYLRHRANPDGRTGPILCVNPRCRACAPAQGTQGSLPGTAVVGGPLPTQLSDELATLTLGEAADRLR